ncbi:DNA RNA-binding protein Kin17 domain containing protein [Aphelenchoides besseyi]|nr:DNA RNA-binding protein Kin17 domain containing protein [Aphelenchoides besseyi]KAI6223237.1 DNA RNA-binding protein Kin17 domain containing protein [Aphelenchoides besseyi]
MPKADKGSSKAQANKVKSKGLQKLKWFCQMCNKQCRDQNGFKCHLTSESHQRQLLLFAEDESSYLREFSRDFEATFMHILRFTYGGKRVRANEVYQEYIKDKGHVHMNATNWHSLGGFVRYLGETGKCKIDQTEKGWHIQYIDKENEVRKQQIQEKAKQEKTDEDRMNEILQRQIERALEKAGDEETTEAEPKEFVRATEDTKIRFELAPMKPTKDSIVLPKVEPSGSVAEEDVKPSKRELERSMNRERDVKPDIKREFDSRPSKPSSSGKKRSALEQLRQEEERFKEKRNRKDYWLHEGIIVKIVTKKYGDKFYKAKGEVIGVIDKYKAEIEIPSGDVVKVHQDYLETVIPALDKDMLIVNGAYRGEKAVLEEILEDDFMLKLRIKEGTRNGRSLEVPYEDASKLA